MPIQVETVPERKLFRVSKGGDLSAGKNIKVLVDDVVYENLEFTVPEGKTAHIRIDITGSLSDSQ